jgi:L-ascorbate metabolism protein UlaG (beta-lactamase superfamily)
LKRWLILAALVCTSCINVGSAISSLFESPRRVHKLTQPVRKDARLAVLWIGHATLLIQIEDKLILTDPVFTSAVGQMSARRVEPGLDVANVPKLDAVLISHMHFDHLSLGSLELLQDRVGTLLLPRGGTLYVTDFGFPTQELGRWQSWERDGLRITGVPVIHNGMRYGIDYGWMNHSYTGYVIEYRGVSVYFGGDSAYGKHYRRTRQRFPRIDLALLPIAPIQPRGFMQKSHIDPKEALRAFRDLGARWMVPMHFDTFVNGLDHPGDAERALGQAIVRQRVPAERVSVLGIGEQRVFLRHGENPR